jgi:hypothetical protein
MMQKARKEKSRKKLTKKSPPIEISEEQKLEKVKF